MGWVSNLFRKQSRERQLDSELRFHIEQQIKEYIARGMTPEQARREAALEFGGLEQIKEQCRDVRSGQWLETTGQDLTFGLRSLRRTPGFTIVALATLAVGIGANTAIFSFVDGVLLKPVPYPEADRMVAVSERTPNGSRCGISTLTYLDWAKQNTVFENMAAQVGDEATLTGNGNPVRLADERVSAHFFDIFRIKPALGRVFVEGEDQLGRDHVAVLTNWLWASRFGSDPGVIGHVIVLDGIPTTIVGVMPKGVLDRGWGKVFRPLAFVPENMSRDYHWLRANALLKKGVTLKQARAQMDAIGQRVARDYPASNRGWGVTSDSFATTLVGGELKQSLWVLMAAVGMVLLIACANLANLTLARGIVREREMAIRAALGAGRGRLVRQMVTESLLLSTMGSLLGLGIAFGGIALLRKAPPGGSLPPTADIGVNGSVLLFTLGLSFLTGILFGLIPAIRVSRPDMTRAINDNNATSTAGRTILGLRRGLVIAEVALAFVLLSGAGLLIRSFFQIQKVDLGFDSINLATAYLPIADRRFSSAAEFNLYLRQLTDRIRALPGVLDVALTNGPPINWGWGDTMPFQIDGRKTVDLAQRPACGFKVITPSYFTTLGMKLERGRLLDGDDAHGALPVTVINESMARRCFPNENPVGRRILVQEIKFKSTALGSDIPWEVVGVVRDEKNEALRDENSSGMYVTEEQSPTTWQFIMIRAAMDPGALQKSMIKAVQSVNPDQALDRLETLAQVESASMESDRRRSCLLAIFAGTALLLAGVGLYGVLSYSVAQRTREIGIRTALGATAGDICRLILRNGMALAGAGLAIGFLGAMGLSRIIESMLFNVGQHDPVTLTAVAGILFLTAAVACYIPARRAMRVNPIEALKCE